MVTYGNIRYGYRSAWESKYGREAKVRTEAVRGVGTARPKQATVAPVLRFSSLSLSLIVIDTTCPWSNSLFSSRFLTTTTTTTTATFFFYSTTSTCQFASSLYSTTHHYYYDYQYSTDLLSARRLLPAKVSCHHHNLLFFFHQLPTASFLLSLPRFTPIQPPLLLTARLPLKMRCF